LTVKNPGEFKEIKKKELMTLTSYTNIHYSEKYVDATSIPFYSGPSRKFRTPPEEISRAKKLFKVYRTRVLKKCKKIGKTVNKGKTFRLIPFMTPLPCTQTVKSLIGSKLISSDSH
jgi:hypothetical protein